MKKTYYLFNPGRLSRKDDTVKFTQTDSEGKELKPRYLPVEDIDQLFVFGSLDANSAFYNFMGKKQVPLHFFDYYENYTGSFMPREYLLAGSLLMAQTEHHRNPGKRLAIGRALVQGAAHNMLKNLRYYNTRGKDTQPVIEQIEQYTPLIDTAREVDELMGIEGNIRRTYYEAFELIINDFAMDGRSMQPPQNEVNALISFGNMICYANCLRAIHQTQLNPTISFLHSPGARRYSLALDLAEIFKPIMVDRVIFKVLNKRLIQQKDFEEKVNRVLLKDSARQRFLKAMDEQLGQTIKHRDLNRQVSYKHLIKLEAYKLIKHLLGDTAYKPFKIWW